MISLARLEAPRVNKKVKMCDGIVSIVKVGVFEVKILKKLVGRFKLHRVLHVLCCRRESFTCIDGGKL